MKEHVNVDVIRRPGWSTVAGAAAAVILGAAGARAQEVIVKNDSVVIDTGNFGQLNNFGPGDQAGARLIMPCDGRIVGVQIGWVGTFAGQIITTEAAIHIFEDGTFPDPGPELATVVDPIMVSNPLIQIPTMNEFRHLDPPDNTMPIDIPVLMDDAIIVTLEFANPTNIGAGGPNVTGDLDGCTDMANVLYAISTGLWYDGCTFANTDIVVRLIVDCDEPGACCMPDGTCTEILINDCDAAGGTFQGEGTTCGGVTCPQPPGACCITATQGCIYVTDADCITAGGSWQGFGTNCTSYDCFPTGACCLPSGDCITATEIDCGGVGGTWAGAGISCGGVSCPQPCPSDVDDSGAVDISDLLLLLSKWGPCPAPCIYDIDENGEVDISDLLTLLGAWGPCG